VSYDTNRSSSPFFERISSNVIKIDFRVIVGVARLFFSNQKYQFGRILGGLGLENVDLFCGHSEYFTDNWDVLSPFGTFVLIWYIFLVLASCAKKYLATLVNVCLLGFTVRDELFPSLDEGLRGRHDIVVLARLSENVNKQFNNYSER
jgi:hypothetical protein